MMILLAISLHLFIYTFIFLLCALGHHAYAPKLTGASATTFAQQIALRDAMVAAFAGSTERTTPNHYAVYVMVLLPA